MRKLAITVAVTFGAGLALVSGAQALAPTQPKFVALSNSMVVGRYGPAMARTEGKVLVAGGAANVGFGEGGAIKLTELFDPAGNSGGTFTALGATANLTTSRYFPLAAPLPGGKVLIAGGFTEGGSTLTSAAIYDPGTGKITNLPVETQTSGPETQMHTAREGAFAAPLSDGRVLVGGGRDSEALRSAEIFDPTTDDFTTAPLMESTREGATAAPLSDGRVLVVGGRDNLGHVLASVEIYDPSMGEFAEPPESMGTPRIGAVASPLPDGNILIAGGSNSTKVLRSAEIFDPETEEFIPLPETGTTQLTVARLSAASAPLPDGRVLIAGGTHDTTDTLSSAEVFESAPEAQAADPNFGDQVVGVGGSKSITVKNIGDQALEVEGFGINGPDPGDFSVGASTCATPVPAGETCKFTLDFDPSTLGERVATVRLSDNEPVSLTLIVKGTGVKESPKGGAGGGGGGGGGGSSTPTPGSARFDLLRCHRLKGRAGAKRSRCTATAAPGTVELTSSSIRATLRRKGKVVASGRATSKKATRLELTPSQELTPGTYKLTLSFRDGHGHRHSIIRKITIT